MRDLLIVAIVGVAALLALRRPWVGILLWTWLSIMNPHRYAWGFAYSAPVAAAAAGATVLGLIFTKDRRSPFRGPPVYWLAAFAVWVTLSWMLGIDPAGEQGLWERVMKIYFMTFVALSLLNSKIQAQAFAWVTVASIGLLAAKGGLFTILTGGSYRVFGPPSSFIEDNNDFALATVVCIPMLHFLALQLPKAWMRHVISVVMLLCAASALGSQSRGGLVALIAMGAAFWLRSPNKKLIAVMALVVGLALIPAMPESWWARMQTIQTYSQDGSAMGRINAWHVAWQTALHYFTGGGMSFQYQFLFDEYGPYEHLIRAAHSIYFQVLGNHGFVGLFLFLMMWIATFRVAGRLRKSAALIPQAKWAQELATAVQASLIGYAVGGAFLSLPYFDLPYNLMVMVVVASNWVERRAWETERPMSLREAIGLGGRQEPRLAPSAPRAAPPDLVPRAGLGGGRARPDKPSR